jgi:hypothetical protein
MEENRMPKMIFSQELEEMSKGENTVKWIKGQRISWLGHLERMEENRMSKIMNVNNKHKRDSEQARSRYNNHRETRLTTTIL